MEVGDPRKVRYPAVGLPWGYQSLHTRPYNISLFLDHVHMRSGVPHREFRVYYCFCTIYKQYYLIKVH